MTVLPLSNSKFCDYVGLIYRIELQMKDITDTATPTSYIDLDLLEVESRCQLRTSIRVYPCFIGVRVARSLVLCVVCCPPLFVLFATILSVLRILASDCPFVIFKHFFWVTVVMVIISVLPGENVVPWFSPYLYGVMSWQLFVPRLMSFLHLFVSMGEKSKMISKV